MCFFPCHSGVCVCCELELSPVAPWVLVSCFGVDRVHTCCWDCLLSSYCGSLVCLSGSSTSASRLLRLLSHQWGWPRPIILSTVSKGDLWIVSPLLCLTRLYLAQLHGCLECIRVRNSKVGFEISPFFSFHSGSVPCSFVSEGCTVILGISVYDICLPIVGIWVVRANRNPFEFPHALLPSFLKSEGLSASRLLSSSGASSALSRSHPFLEPSPVSYDKTQWIESTIWLQGVSVGQNQPRFLGPYPSPWSIFNTVSTHPPAIFWQSGLNSSSFLCSKKQKPVGGYDTWESVNNEARYTWTPQDDKCPHTKRNHEESLN